MEIGGYTVESLIDGYFGLDGGAMFGIVPNPLWRRGNPPDERNRIELAARCLLLRGNGRCILVETGIGDKFDDKRADIFNVRPSEGGLRAQLGARGIAPEDVTDVILTHLHFDHCGGTTHRAAGELSLSFPAAVHHVQRRQWEWAHQPTAKDGGSYRGEDFALLAGDDRLRLLDGDVEVIDGVAVHVLEGHTAAMQMVSVRDGDAGLLFCADLVPTKAHLRWPYIMAYDNEPLTTLAEKQRWLPRVATAGEIVVFGHDPTCDGAVLRIDDRGVVVQREVTF